MPAHAVVLNSLIHLILEIVLRVLEHRCRSANRQQKPPCGTRSVPVDAEVAGAGRLHA
jgi:hypothetical protein